MLRDPSVIREHYARQREQLARAIELVNRATKIPTDPVLFAMRHDGLPIWAVKVAIKVKSSESQENV